MSSVRVANLKLLAELLDKALPEIRWHQYRSNGLDGTLAGSICRLWFDRRDKFGWLLCRHLAEAGLKKLVQKTSIIYGPSRLVRQAATGAIGLVASWPVQIPVEAQATVLAADLRIVLNSGFPNALPSVPISSHAKQRLKDVAASRCSIKEIPTNGKTWDFIVEGRGSTTSQFSAWQPNESAVLLNTLVTNWTADARGTVSATATLMLVLNGRLRWVKLVRRGSAIEAQVAIPVDAVTAKAWDLARQALGQAVMFCREPLRMIQLPEVARVFEETHQIVRAVH